MTPGLSADTPCTIRTFGLSESALLGAGPAVGTAQGVHDQFDAALREIEGLRTALITQRMIGQATGILMERFDLTAGVAFDVMRRLSSHSNVKLRRIAQGIVETGTLPAVSAPNHRTAST